MTISRILTFLTAATLLASCSKNHEKTKADQGPKPNQYTVLVRTISLPADKIAPLIKESENPQILIHELMARPDAKIKDFPPLYVAQGEQGVLDKTKSKKLPSDSAYVTGKEKLPKRTYKLGEMIKMRIETNDTGIVSYQFSFYYRKLKGMKEVPHPGGGTVEIPIFDRRTIKTQFSQPLDSWNLPGGCASTETASSSTNETKNSWFLCIKILPPKEEK